MKMPGRIHRLLFSLAWITISLTGCSQRTPDIAPHEDFGGGARPLEFDAIYGPHAVNFSGSQPATLHWQPTGAQYVLREPDGRLRLIDAETGEAAPAYDVAALQHALVKHAGFNEATARRRARHPSQCSDDYGLALIEHEQRLYLYRFASDELDELDQAPIDRRETSLGPSGKRVAFVHGNNLHTLRVADGQVTALTQDGSTTVLNGVLDWVYQEEVFGRHNWRGYWWSSDGQHIAYLQLDDERVPTHPLVNYRTTHPEVTMQRYPKAGDPNPVARLGIVPADGGTTVWADLSKYNDVDLLIVHVSWTPDNRVLCAVQDRESRWLDLNIVDPQTGTVQTLIHEEPPGWARFYGPPHWLEDGSFLWQSDRDGWPHLYLVRSDGKLIRRITEGRWEVCKLHGVDEEIGRAYFTGTCDTTTENHAYYVSLTGGWPQRLTTTGASHSVVFDDTLSYFIDRYSNVTTPTRIDLRRSDGKLVRTIHENEVPALADYRLRVPEFVEFTTPLGYTLQASILRPPQRLWTGPRPVMVVTYGGPHGSIVHNRWHGRGGMFEQLLAQKGYYVFRVDPYSATRQGAVSAWHAYQRLGTTELRDIEAALRWLDRREPVDLGRVGISGHSYGGYLVAYALTHSTMFRVGIAAAPVTDWRNYDSIYTERFMRMPANNTEGYANASVVAAAEQLTGRLLLAHGALDDNVHVQNTYQLMRALQDAGKSFDVMIYPTDGHGMYGNGAHWPRLQYDFIREHL